VTDISAHSKLYVEINRMKILVTKQVMRKDLS